MDAARRQLDGVPLVDERLVAVQGVATGVGAEAEAGVATAEDYLVGVDTEAVRVVCLS